MVLEKDFEMRGTLARMSTQMVTIMAEMERQETSQESKNQSLDGEDHSRKRVESHNNQCVSSRGNTDFNRRYKMYFVWKHLGRASM